jgi:hypothetical protein
MLHSLSPTPVIALQRYLTITSIGLKNMIYVVVKNMTYVIVGMKALQRCGSQDPF